MRGWSRCFSVATVALVLWSSPLVADEKYDKQFTEARKYLEKGNLKKAEKQFRKANKRTKNSSPECFLELAKIYWSTEEYEKAVEASDELLSHAGTGPSSGEFRFRSHYIKGIALAAIGDDPENLRRSVDAFRSALGETVSAPDVRLRLARALLMLGHTEEGVAEFRATATESVQQEIIEEASWYAENPERVTGDWAPWFSVGGVDGEEYSTETLGGKVVVLDFWATWCPPCIEALPTIKELHPKLAALDAVLVGVSLDNDDTVMRRFAAQKGMNWLQLHDRGRVSVKFFGRTASIPAYVVLDRNGRIVFELVGDLKKKHIKRILEIAESTETQ